MDNIIQTGHYQFEFSSTEAIVISLHYCHGGSAQATPSGQSCSLEKKEAKEGSGKERWSKEQIDDFVRKLGFLDSEKEGGDKIKNFLHLNEVVLMAYMFNYMCGTQICYLLIFPVPRLPTLC